MVNNGEGSAGGQGKRDQSTMRCSGAEDGKASCLWYRYSTNTQVIGQILYYLCYGYMPSCGLECAHLCCKAFEVHRLLLIGSSKRASVRVEQSR